MKITIQTVYWTLYKSLNKETPYNIYFRDIKYKRRS